MPQRNLIIYCDESVETGRYYSRFYGGALIEAARREVIEARLAARKAELNLGAELKWTKITASYADKYISFIDTFFNLIGEGEIKLRIMFSQNMHQPVGLNQEQIANQYFLLYYQLIKHAFGLMHMEGAAGARISLFLDDIPDKSSNYDGFKNFVADMGNTHEFLGKNVSIAKEDITDVNSKHHLVLQGLDIILGAMQFRLNGQHLLMPEGKKRRAKRTIAKERVYRAINSRIRQLYPNFNIGVSTSSHGSLANRWLHPYRHWLFIPANHKIVPGATKKKK